MIGAALIALAFVPKVTAALIATPLAVAASYIVVLGLLFVRAYGSCCATDSNRTAA